MADVNEYIETNRRNWDDRVPIHLASNFYDVASFKAGSSTLLPIERAELGLLYILDGHPVAEMLDDGLVGSDVRLGFPYLGAEPLPFESELTYTDQQADVEHRRSYTFSHGLGEIVTSMVDAGLEVEFLHEFTFGFFPRHPSMLKRADGYYEMPDNQLQLPFMFSIRARKP